MIDEIIYLATALHDIIDFMQFSYDITSTVVKLFY
jgi:hypothetical protein